MGLNFHALLFLAGIRILDSGIFRDELVALLGSTGATPLSVLPMPIDCTFENLTVVTATHFAKQLLLWEFGWGLYIGGVSLWYWAISSPPYICKIVLTAVIMDCQQPDLIWKGKTSHASQGPMVSMARRNRLKAIRKTREPARNLLEAFGLHGWTKCMEAAGVHSSGPSPYSPTHRQLPTTGSPHNKETRSS